MVCSAEKRSKPNVEIHSLRLDRTVASPWTGLSASGPHPAEGDVPPGCKGTNVDCVYARDYALWTDLSERDYEGESTGSEGQPRAEQEGPLARWPNRLRNVILLPVPGQRPVPALSSGGSDALPGVSLARPSHGDAAAWEAVPVRRGSAASLCRRRGEAGLPGRPEAPTPRLRRTCASR